MTDKLKNCPFCGGEAFEYYSGSQFEFCEVVCKECGCRSKRKTEEEAIEAWNTRKPMDGIVEKLEEMMQRHIAEAKRQEKYGNYYNRDHERYAAGTYKYFIKQLKEGSIE